MSIDQIDAVHDRYSQASKILFLLMPWAQVSQGGLGIATLKAILNRDGVEAECRYPNVDLARQIGADFYRFIGGTGGKRYCGEIFFSPHYFELPVEQFVDLTLQPYYHWAIELFRDVLGGELRPESDAEFIGRCRRMCLYDVPSFLDNTMRSINWAAYDIIGFSLMFHQTLSSLCLSRRIKQAYPEKTIIFGGPSCAASMGEEMIRAFPWVDIVATGEADDIITPLIRTVRAKASLSSVSGIVFREQGRIIATPAAPLVTELDRLPIPNYDDYIEVLQHQKDLRPRLLFETSRGCWWGQKYLCTFCGLNAEGLSYRRKSPGRAIDEILGQARRYGVTELQAADNIMDMSYFKDVLPALAQFNAGQSPGRRLSIMYETKSNLKKHQMALMKEAGLDSVQAGIESFSDHVLALMKKGATGIQQVQCVKWSTELYITNAYGILYDNPGETIDDYVEMESLVDYIQHLSPPSYITPVILDRFSPYYMRPGDYGVRNVRPQEGDVLSFPDPSIALEKLVYHFEYDCDDQANQDLRAAVERCVKRLRLWRQNYRPNTLVYENRHDDVYILDRRGDKPTLSRLRGIRAEIFRYFDVARGLDEAGHPWDSTDRVLVQAFLATLVERKWMYRDSKDRYISLPVLRSFLNDIRWKETNQPEYILANPELQSV
jgi:ribosomal peptide maturation radical SAM protein 1